MDVPTEEEKDIADNEVLDSPNEDEKSRIRSSIHKYKNEIEKQSIIKMAKYMNNVVCESCGNEVTPDSSDGRCPRCGAMGGVSPKPNPSLTKGKALQSRDQVLGRLMDEIYTARQNFYNRY